MRHISLRLRLIGGFVGVVLLVLLVHDLPLASYIRVVERDRIVTGLQRDAFVLAGRAEEALQVEPIKETSFLTDLAVNYRESTGASVLIVDRRGTVIAAAGPGLDTGGTSSGRPEIAEALKGAPVSGERESRSLGEPLLFVAVPVLSGTQTYGAVRLTYSVSAVDTKVGESVRGLLLVALLTLAAAVVVAVLVAGSLARPVTRLRAAAARLADGDLSARPHDPGGPPELRDLAADLSVMAERVDDLVTAQRTFSGDASHQLRTPLTALRLRLDGALDALEGNDVERTARDLEAARSETERLARLVDGLLALARVEGRRVEHVDVDVASVVAERVDLWSPLAAERQVSVVSVIPPGASWIAHAMDGAVEQIIDNYIDNALEVSPPGSTVAVTIRGTRDHIGIHVVDQGPGLDEESRVRAFDRFWRGRQDETGSGLGLAIVAALARASNADVGLHAGPGGGLDAFVELPRASRWRPPPTVD